MEVITEWWNHPIAEEVHGCLRYRELSIPQYKAQSPQLCARRYLVDWLAAICEKFHLCTTSRHLTTLLLDIFMDQYDVKEEHLKLVSIGCLLLACKFEEREVKIPKYAELNEYFSPPIDHKTYLSIELQLLSSFQWNVGLPTAAHFSEYYFQHATDGIPAEGREEIEKYKMYISKYMHYFLEISMQDEVYRKYPPSLVASASLAASRSCLHCAPIWNRHLENLTGYRWDYVQTVVDIMHGTLKKDEEKQKDQPVSVCDTITPPRGPNSPISPSAANYYHKVAQPTYHPYQTRENPHVRTLAKAYPNRKS